MSHRNEQIRWAVRVVRAAINKGLVSVVGVKKLKILNAKYYLKKEINLEKPEKLNEKILYLAYSTDTRLWSRLADKYEVREYVREKGFEEILVPVYGVYNSFEEIDFGRLPEKFVLKATHGCDMNYICRDKKELDLKKVKKKINFWLKNNLAYISLELHYAKIPPRIMCERFLESEGEIIDYKFFCCNGEVRFIEVCTERSKGPYLDIFMPDWTWRSGVIVGAKNNPDRIEKPKQFDRMKEIAAGLAEGLPFVRVDLYEVNGQVYFGEMTFTPATGVLFHFSEEFLIEQGKRFLLKERESK